MPTPKKPREDDDHGLVPHFVYRKTSKTAQRVLGLGISQINEGIRDGSIPQPIDLTPNGRAKGWTGAQLIEHQQKRLAERRKPAGAA